MVIRFVCSNMKKVDVSSNPSLVLWKIAVVRSDIKPLSERKLTFHQILIFTNRQILLSNSMVICDALGDLVLLIQFKKREKHPWRSINFSKVAGFSLQIY